MKPSNILKNPGEGAARGSKEDWTAMLSTRDFIKVLPTGFMRTA